MKNPLLVGVLEGFTNLWHDRERLAGRESPRPHRLTQVDPVDTFHEQVVKPAGLAEVENADDVCVVQPCEHTAFAIESFGKLGISRELVGQQF